MISSIFSFNTFLDRVRSIGRRHKDHLVGTADDNANREHCVRCRAGTRIRRNLCGQVAVPVPLSPDMDIRVGIFGNIFCHPASRVAAIRRTVPPHTDSETDPPMVAAKPRSSLWRPSIPSSLVITSPTKIFVIFHNL